MCCIKTIWFCQILTMSRTFLDNILEKFVFLCNLYPVVHGLVFFNQPVLLWSLTGPAYFHTSSTLNFGNWTSFPSQSVSVHQNLVNMWYLHFETTTSFKIWMLPRGQHVLRISCNVCLASRHRHCLHIYIIHIFNSFTPTLSVCH